MELKKKGRPTVIRQLDTYHTKLEHDMKEKLMSLGDLLGMSQRELLDDLLRTKMEAAPDLKERLREYRRVNGELKKI